MYASTSNLTLNPLLPAAGKRLSAPPKSLSFPGSRRRITINASVSTFAEPVPVDSGKATSLYEILRVKQTASLMEIKTAYRTLAKLYHPDAIHEEVESDGRDFIEIHNAYETLSDPAARALYDLSLEAAASSEFNQRRRRRTGVGFMDGYCSTRNWETDQCW